jgi:hypothetical protein
MNAISATLSQDDRDAIGRAIQLIESRLPFLIDLVAEERTALPKMGDKTRAFVDKAFEVASTNPDFLPRSFDVEEMRKDLELYQDLNRIRMSLLQLQDMIDDTCMLAGSEAYTAALTVYNSAKTNGMNNKGMEPIVQELRERFRRTRKTAEAKES